MALNTLESVKLASTLLKQGKLVAIPTETVYGLAADASQTAAIQEIFIAKGRPNNHPLIVHLANVSQIWDWGKQLSQESIKDIECLAEHFWPGPLTIIMKKADWVPDIITGGQDTVAIRIPNHPLTLDLLGTLPNGLVAPSANRFGRISPTTPAHVHKELGDKVAYILDGGPCTIGLESTIVNLSGEQPVILRPGMISHEQLSAALNKPVLFINKDSTIRAPGVLDSHYAPNTAFYRISDNDITTAELINELEAVLPDSKIALIGHVALENRNENAPITYRSLSHHPEAFSQNFYSTLHELDEAEFDSIFCHLDEKLISQDIRWLSVLDRLQKAAHHDITLHQIKLIMLT